MPQPHASRQIFNAQLTKVRCALAVMTKAPRAGTSKTRLTPPLTSQEAARLSECFLRDTCENIAGICLDGTSDGVAVYTPVSAAPFFKRLLPDSFSRLGQRGNLFGDRLFHATDDLISSGYDSVCLIDSDSPTLPAAFLRAAVFALTPPGDRVVLGPAEDGGYYLIGLKAAHRRLFEEVDWSTSRVLRQTIKRANEINLEVRLLPAWFDVDDAASLRQLCRDLFGNGRQPARSVVGYEAPHTRAHLSGLLETSAFRRHIWNPAASFDKAISRKRRLPGVRGPDAALLSMTRDRDQSSVTPPQSRETSN